MARLVVSLVVLVITLIVWFIVWIVQRATAPNTAVRMVNFNPPPGGFGGRPGPFGPPGGGPPMGGFGGPPAPGGYGAPMQGGFGAPAQGGFGGQAQGGYGGQAQGGYGGQAQGGFGGQAQGGYGGQAQGGYGGQPQGGYGAQAQGGYGGQAGQQAGFGPAAPGAIRLVVRPDCTFERLSDCMTRAGMSVTAPPGPQVQAGEPSSAVWQSDSAQVRYLFDARTYLRAMEITGPGAQAARQGMIQLASLPALDGAQIVHLLQTPRPGDQMLGLAAAEHLGPGPEAQMFGGMLAGLAQSPQPEIAAAARRAQQRLGHVA